MDKLWLKNFYKFTHISIWEFQPWTWWTIKLWYNNPIIRVTVTADIYSPPPHPTLNNGLAQLVDDLFTKIIFAKFRADLIWLIHRWSLTWEGCSCSGWTVLITLYGEIKQGETGEPSHNYRLQNWENLNHYLP